jgi:hypothetical protein
MTESGMNDHQARGELMISPEAFPQWAADRLAAHERALAALHGKTRAMESALGLVIGFHPNAELLRSKWQAASSDLVDVAIDSELFEAPAFREAFQSTMAFVAQVLDAAADRQRGN